MGFSLGSLIPSQTSFLGDAMKNLTGQKQAGNALNTAMATQKQMAQKQLELLRPYYEAGAAALPDYTAYARQSPFTQDESGNYDFSGQYGESFGAMENALSRKLRAMGRENSSYGIDTYADMARDYAGQLEQQRYNRLSDLIKMGQMQAGQMGNVYGNQANALTSLLGQQGQLATAYSPFRIGMDILGGVGKAYGAMG